VPDASRAFVDRHEQQEEDEEQVLNVQRVPARKGKKECEFFVKTGRCGYGMKCKYDHPIDRMLEMKATSANTENLPIRPAAETCEFFLKTSYCKFGWTCKFNHPQNIIDKRNAKRRNRQLQVAAQQQQQQSMQYAVQSLPYILEPEYAIAVPIPVVGVPMYDPFQERFVYFVEGMDWSQTYAVQ